MTHIVSRCCYLSVQVNAWVSFVCKKTSRQINIRAESVVLFFLFCIIFLHQDMTAVRTGSISWLWRLLHHTTFMLSAFFKRELNSVDSMNPLSFRATSSNILAGGRLFETTITVSRLGTLTLYECQCCLFFLV